MEIKSEIINSIIPEKREPVLTMAFVNIQPFDSVYSLSEGFNQGTIFPDLDKPFLAAGDKK